VGIRRGDYPLSSKCAIGEGGLRAVDGTQADTEEEAVFKDNVSNYGELRAAIPNLFWRWGLIISSAGALRGGLSNYLKTLN